MAFSVAILRVLFPVRAPLEIDCHSPCVCGRVENSENAKVVKYDAWMSMARLAPVFRFAFALALFASTSQSANCAEPVFEQVLVPFDTAVFPGQFGALWSAELWVRNDGEQPVNLFPEKCSFIGLEAPCTTRIDIPARSTTLVDVLKRASPSMPGIFLYVPQDRVADLQFNLRIQDLSKLSQSAGTEIQVVRQRDYRTGRTNLLNVPLREGFRPTLRVYSPYLGPQSQFIVRVYRDPGDDLLLERTYTESLPTDAGPTTRPGDVRFQLGAGRGASRRRIPCSRRGRTDLSQGSSLLAAAHDH